MQLKRCLQLIKNISASGGSRQTIHTHRAMACSRYEYVKGYERDDSILPNVWIVVRVDGKGFHKFSKVHDFDKPNDENGMTMSFSKY